MKLERDGWIREGLFFRSLEREPVVSNNFLVKQVYKIMDGYFRGLVQKVALETGLEFKEVFNELFLFVSKIVLEKFSGYTDEDLRYFIASVASFWRKKFKESLRKYKGRYKYRSELRIKEEEEGDMDVLDYYLVESIHAIQVFENTFIEFISKLDDIREEVVNEVTRESF